MHAGEPARWRKEARRRPRGSVAELLHACATGYVRAPGALRPAVPPGRNRSSSVLNMPAFIVQGGSILSGRIRPAGNKNAALPCITACLLSTEPVTLSNVPRIRDVLNLLEIMESLGASVEWTKDNTVRIDASGVTAGNVDREMASEIRASLLLAGPLLARFGEVNLPPPGGDVIGWRRIDTHFLAFEALGGRVRLDEGFHVKAERLVGTTVFLDEPSVTGTENAIMAAVLAGGTTLLRNSASEPHVQDLCHQLNLMGAHVSGIGTNTLKIEGVKDLHGAEFAISADHIETGSFMGLAAVTGGTITIEDAPIEHLDATLMGFRRLGIECELDGGDLVVRGEGDHVIRQDAFGAVSKIDDGPWPAFPADLTSIMVVTATQCRGTILIHEKMFESRMFFTDKLVGMGARIVLCDPHRAVVVGPAPLRASQLESPDIRAGMALLIAALGAEGTSRIHNIRQIERGYERIDERLRALGANIERED